MPRVTWSKFVNLTPKFITPSPTPIEEWGELQKPAKIGVFTLQNKNTRKFLSLILIFAVFSNHPFVGVGALTILALEYGAKQAYKL